MRSGTRAIFWLNTKDKDSLKQSFVKAAKQILREDHSANRLSSVDIKENLDEVIDAVKEWLSLPNNTRWLMMYDNYDNPKLAGNTDPEAVGNSSQNHIKVQSLLQHGHRKSRFVSMSGSESWRTCAIVSRFYQMHRDEEGS